MKKILSAILVLTLLLSTVTASTIVTFASEVDSKELANAIGVVKKVIDIPDDFSEFNYYYDQYDEETQKGYNVSLEWTNPDDYEYISACVSNDGNIIYYHSNRSEFKGEGLAKITKKEAKKIAGDYLKKFCPKIIGDFKLEDSLVNGYGNDYNFNYKMYVNDIPCDFISATISINKYVGKLSHYSYDENVKGLSINDFPTKDKIIKLEEAKNIYLSDLGPELKYLSDYDYSKKLLKVFTAYLTDYSNRAIDANTGNIVDLYNEYGLYRNSVNESDDKEEKAADGGESKIKYTEEELKEIERVENLIDKNQAEKIARKLVINIGNEELKSLRLMKDNGPNQEYSWSLNFEKGYVRVDAKTGQLISFYCYSNDDTNTKRDIGLEKAKKISEKYLKKVCSDVEEQIKWTNESTIDNKYRDYTFIYTRQVNEISFDDNSIYMSVNKENGDVVSYSRNWYKDTDFPGLDGVIAKEKAFDIVAELGDFGLIYKQDSEGKIILAYDFKKNANLILDAYKGVRLDYRGEIYKEPIESIEYTDIDGIWAENIIKELKENGYYLEGENFKPKEKTTQIEFFKYLYSLEKAYYAEDEDFYKMLIDRKIINKEEVNANAYITRQEAAKYVTRFLGVDKLAKESSIFRNMYKDKIDKEYLGYASAVYVLDIMKGDSKGRFNGNKPLNHAESAIVIYNLLNVN